MTDTEQGPGPTEIHSLDLTDIGMAARVLALQLSSYRVEAELIGRDDIPRLHDDVVDIQSCGETFFGSFVGNDLVGVVAYKVLEDTLDLHRVMVDPRFFRRGVARKLIEFVEALESRTRRSVVTTGSRNAPARRLYTQLGYVEIGEREVAPGFGVVAFEKRGR
jgi:GNAT superfamily N-acetyltransferase